MATITEQLRNALLLSVLREHLEEEELTVRDAFEFIKTTPIMNMTLNDFCQKMLSENIDEETSKKTLFTQKKKWELWSSDLQEEILYVLNENDSGRRKISLQDYLKRLQEKDSEITEYSLIQFCKDHGRRGWTNG